MENLNRQQLILLALLVSFVTSIATGIVTVSLMDQAPAGVTQTINRVVEKTIERIVQAPTQAAAVVTKEVIVTEQDLITAAIEKNTNSVVKIEMAQVMSETTGVFAGLGVVVSSDGVIVADRTNFIPEINYVVKFFDGKVLPLAIVFTEEKSRVVIFRAVVDNKEKYNFLPATFGNSDLLKLGQTVIGLSGANQLTAAVGVVSSFDVRDEPTAEGATTTVKVKRALDTTIPVKDFVTGGPLINTSGEVIAVKVAGSDMSYVPINLIKKILPNSDVTH
ncbi:MAG TPA: serine protease [Candidatus Paceibacterota bacterium]